MNSSEAKTNVSKLVGRARAGERIVVARTDVPYARLAPLNAPTRLPRRLGLLGQPVSEEGARESLSPLDPDEARLWD